MQGSRERHKLGSASPNLQKQRTRKQTAFICDAAIGVPLILFCYYYR